MKLKKYEDKRKKNRKAILISLGVIILISVSLLLYKTFASFSEEVEFPMMKGQVDYFGNSDIYFAFYNGNDKLDSMPLKDNGDNLVFDYGECDNGAYVEWNNEEWAPLIRNLSKSKTKCSLYFKEKTSINICNKYGSDSALCYISKLGDNDYDNMAYDHASANSVLDNNLRYVGANVNNYIDIGDRDGNGNPILWRIIGVMNNIINLDNGGRQESLVKIIRAESIGDYSWDSSPSGINDGYGINEWSQADLMKILNPNTVYSGTPAIGGSLYWNRGSGSCYSGLNEENTTCDFTSSGLSEEAKSKIAKVRWNTGTFATYDNTQWTARTTYEAERGSHNGKEQCISNGGGIRCNDTVPRTTTWEGYIGLMYPSDYGYAVGGNVRETCLGESMYNYDGGSCNTNDWLKPSGDTWTMTSSPYTSNSYNVFFVHSDGIIPIGAVYPKRVIQPVVYLSSSVKIIDGNGTQGMPFIASLN